MREIKALLADLSARLPELEWKISGLGTSFSNRSLPKGLFHSAREMNGALCIAEIKSDIRALSAQTNKLAAAHLAQQIQQKINVLVALCQINSKRNKPDERPHFGLDSLSTRQQWIQTLEADIQQLLNQRLAVQKALDSINLQSSPQIVLNLQAELGAIEKRLTLAQETLNRAIA